MDHHAFSIINPVKPSACGQRLYIRVDALKLVNELKPRRNDNETLMEFIRETCREKGLKLECPECHFKFYPGEEEKENVAERV